MIDVDCYVGITNDFINFVMNYQLDQTFMYNLSQMTLILFILYK